MNDRFLTEKDLPWLYNFTVTKGNIYSVLEAQDAKTLKEMGEWLESEVLKIPYIPDANVECNVINKLLGKLIEALRRGEMPK